DGRSAAVPGIAKAMPLGLSLRRDEIGRERGAFAKEVVVHLLQQKLLRFLGAEVEAVLVHEHLHVLHPHLPRFLGDALEDLLAERMALERHFIQAFHLFLEFDAEYFSRAGANRIPNLVEAAAVSTTHLNGSPSPKHNAAT